MGKLVLIAAAAAFIAASGMAQAAQPLVDVAWVKANIAAPNTVFLDVRGKLAGMSKANYVNGHIPGAVWTNYLKDGWRVKDKNGTVGQMASVDKLEKLIGGLGIGNDTHVVVVPAGNKALDVGTATRIYWTFKVLGHDNVSILNGGMAAYTRARDKKTKKPVNPLETGEAKIKAASFKAKAFRKEMIATKADVKKASAASAVLVDNRPNNQFLGVNKHGMAKRFGTVPGAKNVPENWMTTNGGGTFRDRDALARLYKFAGVPTTGSQINFCNTGHWASLGWFVSSEILGNKAVTMYDGSMVEWSADEGLPIQAAVKAN